VNPVQFDEVRRAATGRWRSILASMGVLVPDRPTKHAICPGCGGRDRFRFDDLDGRGTYLCSGGGGEPRAGDGFDLLSHVFGWRRAEALQRVAGALILNPEMPTSSQSAKPSRTAIYALEVWGRAAEDDGLVAAHPYCQRKRVDCAFGARSATVSGSQIGQRADCVVIPIRRQGVGEIVAVQAINESGAKQTFGPMGEDFLLLGNVTDRNVDWHLAEGWATAHTIARLEPACVVGVAFGSSRLDRVAREIVERYAPERLFVHREAK